MRPYVSFTLALAFAGFCVTARAADVPKPPPKPRGLMAMLQKAMIGHAVLAVGEGPWQVREADYDEKAFAAATDEVGRLQVIAQAASTDDMPMIPFAVGQAWVIAPQYRQDLNTDFRGLSADRMRSQGDWLARALLAIPGEQMAQAVDGIAFADLPKASQAALMAALHPPFRVMKPRKMWFTFPDGQQHEVSDAETAARVVEPVDWKRTRFRARLMAEGARVTRPDTNQTWTLGQRAGDSGLFLMPDARSDNGRIPVYTDVPNTFRASDLDTKPFQQPVGRSGIHSAREVVARLAEVTGLRLHVMHAFEKAPLFLGRDDLSCGDVMDGMRLELTGTWRRLGNDYILAWDKPGWAADQEILNETAGGLYDKMQRRTLDDGPDPAWLTVAENLSFAPDDPLAWTDEQRTKLFRLDWKPGDPAWPSRASEPTGAPRTLYDDPNIVRIPYDQMTPEQQAFLRESAKTEQMSIWHGPGQPVEKQPFTAADISNASLDNLGGPRVVIDLYLPGFGWIGAGGRNGLDYYTLIRIREGINREADSRKRQGEKKPKPPYTPKASTLPAKSRGLIVPTLGPSEVTELIGRMKAHGLDTLFYPALDGGYATFPSKAFPLAPSLRGKDGFAAAALAAKANGIRLVAWLSPVAWQRADQRVHWLDKRREWLDVDALGRTPLQWWNGQSEGKSPEQAFMQGLYAFNYVRPTEPEVARRLDVFVDECARLPGAVGLAVLNWRPPPASDGWQNGDPPPLGFALPDRIAALSRTGYDPVDENIQMGNSGGPWETPDVMGLLGNYDLPKPEPADAPYAALADRLIQRVKARRHNWTTYRADVPHEDRPPETDVPGDLPPAPKPAPPRADVALSVFPAPSGRYEGFTMPLPPRSFMRADVFPPEARDYPALATVGGEPMGRTEGQPQARVGLYDFRQCPEDIMPSLRWIAPTR